MLIRGDPKRAKRITLGAIIRLASTRRKTAGLEAHVCRAGARMRHLELQALVTGGERRPASVLLMAAFRRPRSGATRPRPGRPRQSRRADDAGAGALSAIVGHELNNIAVPLEGFTDLAMQSAPGNLPVRECLEEARIAIARISALAYELESLGETVSDPSSVEIGQCMPEPADLTEAWTIEWRCRSATAVAVDRLQAQRAIRALINLATGTVSRSRGEPVLTVSQDSHPGERCVCCGASVAGRSRHLFAQVGDSRPVLRNVVRNPFGARGAGRSIRPLTLAVLVHCAHCAGGHLLRDKSSGSLSLALPTV